MNEKHRRRFYFCPVYQSNTEFSNEIPEDGVSGEKFTCYQFRNDPTVLIPGQRNCNSNINYVPLHDEE